MESMWRELINSSYKHMVSQPFHKGITFLPIHSFRRFHTAHGLFCFSEYELPSFLIWPVRNGKIRRRGLPAIH